MTAAEQIVMVIVLVVCLVWDALLIYQIRRGETFTFSSQTYEAPRGRSRKTEPTPFWLAIGMQALVANAVILYLLYFLSTSMARQ
jgi:hypothetical protein